MAPREFSKHRASILHSTRPALQGSLVERVFRRLASAPAPAAKSRGGSTKVPRLGTRSGTKQAKVIQLLRQPVGASIEELAKTTGWQSHSLRGVISGALKRKLGLKVASTKEDRGRVYRICDAAPSTPANPLSSYVLAKMKTMIRNFRSSYWNDWRAQHRAWPEHDLGRR